MSNVRALGLAIQRPISFKATLLVFAALLVGACGDSGSDPAASNPPPPGGTNQAPSITGTPQASVMQGTQYSFTPSATDPNNDTLTFTVSGLPSWASFTPSTGRIQGTPTAQNVGTYANIQITVSDGNATAALAAFSITVVATSSGTAMLTWTPPNQNTDGSALTTLGGYRIYWGTTPGSYPNSRTLNGAGSPASAVIDQLTPATWYFVVTAFDTSGNESAYSNVASKVIQ